mmetsp:Transcript_4354/g.5776  ORF Transcript_4354/g.5776 Transcript_4354/m.5776 type:complete len:134 (-) Transcript_4354:184-585(-)
MGLSQSICTVNDDKNIQEHQYQASNKCFSVQRRKSSISKNKNTLSAAAAAATSADEETDGNIVSRERIIETESAADAATASEVTTDHENRKIIIKKHDIVSRDRIFETESAANFTFDEDEDVRTDETASPKHE